MNALQYLMLGMSAIIVILSAFEMVKAVRRRQKYRLFKIPLSAAFGICVTVSAGWPKAIDSAPPLVHWLLLVLLVLWIADTLGFFLRWLLNRQPVEGYTR